MDDHAKLRSLYRHVDRIVADLGDRELRGDVWLAALLLADVEPDTYMANMSGLVKGRRAELERLRDVVTRTTDSVAALGRLIDHVEANHPRHRRRGGRQLAPVAELKAPER